MLKIHPEKPSKYLKLFGTLILFWSLVAQANELPKLDCIIEPNRLIEVESSINGIISEMLVDKGDLVEKNQILVKLESSVEEATVQLKTEQANIDADLNARKVNVKHTKERLDRVLKLYKRKVASYSDKRDAENDAKLAKLDLAKFRQHQKIAKLDLARSIKALERMKIKSPTTGVVLEKYLSEGESVKDKKIIKIAEINPLKIEVIVPSEYFGEIHEGMRAKVFPESNPETPLLANVVIVDKVIDAPSGTFEVRLELANSNHVIPAGIKCMISFVSENVNSTQSNVVLSNEYNN